MIFSIGRAFQLSLSLPDLFIKWLINTLVLTVPSCLCVWSSEGPFRHGKAAYKINAKNTKLPLVFPKLSTGEGGLQGTLSQECQLTFPASFSSSEGLVSTRVHVVLFVTHGGGYRCGQKGPTSEGQSHPGARRTSRTKHLSSHS